MKKIIPYIIALALTAFGLLTMFLSGSIIFDLFGVRAQQGNYVLFVIWANFICSFLYIIAAIGFARQKKCMLKPLGVALIILSVTFIAFNIYISQGGIHEAKTFGALIFRISVTTVFTVLAYFIIKKK